MFVQQIFVKVKNWSKKVERMINKMKIVRYMPMEFSERLRQLLKEKNMTVKDLSRDLKVSDTSIYAWINDERNITATYFFDIAEYFKVNPCWLYGTSDERGI